MSKRNTVTAHPYFFCGIGGSGMLPLATIVKGLGGEVAGSDRSFDQGRTPEKFAWLERAGFDLYPQDGSGITSGEQVLIASAAIEDSVPEVARAKELGCERLTRAELLARLFNAAPHSVAVGGTSGKSTTTAMLGWIMQRAGRAPTIMNGAVMKNFVTDDQPFASAVVGGGDTFVSEVDESDGSIALYRPEVALLLNVSLDHKSMHELRGLFGDFLGAAKRAVVNFDDSEARDLAARCDSVTGFGIDHPDAALGVEPGTIEDDRDGIGALLVDRRDGVGHSLRLPMPGRHNLSNALAAIAAANAARVAVHDAAMALASFAGLARRFDVVGTSENGITVIDDFGHNPEKARATLRTLKAHEGRVVAFFQPHGYGPLRQMGEELAETIAAELDARDVAILCDPVYFGGTVDRSQGSERIVHLIRQAGGHAEYIAEREAVADRIATFARPGDRVVVMGARDDTLTTFARNLLERLRNEAD
ncbi:glutamate ligase domain-containing protein [Aurantiacibacter spongiae]|uniref:UDP-N-acetylmuramate--alanine ligase n=1 Tax=Aurantiacibacter spongiae TaxID=2488860 RepID=A0A3N5CQC9_9SPHN|nr:Mur ligase family protein [Aurantiacibacter spongiae]RPF70586.1 UDP-N-acetylmuramate--alanine ligase [Aurantiacibacter spongiae]